MKNLLRIVFLVFLYGTLSAQNSTPLLESVRHKLNRVNDYTVDMRIKINVNFLKMKDTRARLYFKKPDKIKLEARGFALVPRASFNFSPLRLLQKKFLTVYVKDSLDNAVIKLIPPAENEDIILATLWIDRRDTLISKIEVATRKNGLFQVLYTYGKEKKYGLPQSSRFFFNVKKTGFHHFPVPEDNNTSGGKKQAKNIVGNVTIFYSNYKINTGLKDAVFQDETEEELD